MSQFRRRQLVVDRPRQVALVKAIVTPAVVCLIAGFVAGSWLFSDVVDELSDTAKRTHWITWILGAAVFLAAAIASLLFCALHLSHRIVGPAYRIRQDLNRVMAGERDVRIRLRQGDWLDDVASETNRFLDWSRERPPVGAEPVADEIGCDPIGR